MTARSPFSFPGDRTFAGWWRQFAPLRPCGLWAGHFLVQHVELLTRSEMRCELEELPRYLLQEIVRSPSTTLRQLQSRVHLADATSFLLRDLAHAELIETVGDGWSATASGCESLRHGCYSVPQEHRRSFRFLDLRPHAEPLRIDLPDAVPRRPWPEPLSADQGLTVGQLRPLLPNVELVDFAIDARTPSAWKQIPIVRAEILSVAIAAVPLESGLQLHILGLKPDSWTVPSLDPLLILPTAAFPTTAPVLWQSAWRDWCLARQIPEAEIATCALERQNQQLCVRASQSLLDRLKTARSDVFKGDTWLVAGEGFRREGASIHFT